MYFVYHGINSLGSHSRRFPSFEERLISVMMPEVMIADVEKTLLGLKKFAFHCKYFANICVIVYIFMVPLIISTERGQYE